MSDEEVVVDGEEGEVAADQPLAPDSSQDQGPYTGQSLEIPEVPYNPVGHMTAAEVAEKLAQNQSGESDDDDEDEDEE